MFKKKRCQNCGEKISDSYNFCPYCRFSLNQEKEDWGMLGKNDFPYKEENDFAGSLFGNLSGGMLGKMLNSAVKMLEKEIQKEIKQQKAQPKNKSYSNIRLMVNGKEIDLGNQKIEKESKQKPLPRGKLKDFSKYPKKEPKTDIRRLSNKVVYEMKMPGVNSKNNLSINQLENSIEIKATGNKKSYSKIIPINLPIKNYNLSKGKLILELDAKD